LSEAIENDDEELAKLLKKHGATEAVSQANRGAESDDEPEFEEGNALLAAAVHADTKTIYGLLPSGIDVNFIGQQGQTALGVLVFGLQDESRGRLFYRNAHQCIDLLLRHGARPSLGNPCPFLMAAMGRRLHFEQRPDGTYDWTHKALNRVIQGSSADQTKKAVVDLDRAGYFLQLQVHDETDGSYGSVAEAKAAGNIMRTSILEVCEPLVPFKVDTECGPSWGEIKSV
jgi:hypothetical protein